MSRSARLGVFIFTALLILSAAIFLIGDKQFLFSRTYQLKADFGTVAGLQKGAEIRLGGVRKGTVSEIRMPRRPGEKLTVVMEVEKSTQDVIKKDSVASIDTEGLLGNKFVSISFGSEGAEAVKNGDTIETQIPLDLSDLIKKTGAIMDTTSAALKNVDQATGDLKNITSKINRGEGTVGALINDKTIYNQVSAAAADARETISQAKVGATAFQENMQALQGNFFLRGFFKKRGYKSSADLTKNEIAKLPASQALKSFNFDAMNIFDKPDTAKLKNPKALQPVGKFLETNPHGLVVVRASAGLTGDKQENLVLTQARAMVVREYLAENFKLDDSRIKTKGLGETPGGQSGQLEILVYPGSSEAVVASAPNRLAATDPESVKKPKKKS